MLYPLAFWYLRLLPLNWSFYCLWNLCIVCLRQNDSPYHRLIQLLIGIHIQVLLLLSFIFLFILIFLLYRLLDLCLLRLSLVSPVSKGMDHVRVVFELLKRLFESPAIFTSQTHAQFKVCQHLSKALTYAFTCLTSSVDALVNLDRLLLLFILLL